MNDLTFVPLIFDYMFDNCIAFQGNYTFVYSCCVFVHGPHDRSTALFLKSWDLKLCSGKK